MRLVCMAVPRDVIREVREADCPAGRSGSDMRSRDSKDMITSEVNEANV